MSWGQDYDDNVRNRLELFSRISQFHGTHDQETHGNWAIGIRNGRVHEGEFRKVVKDKITSIYKEEWSKITTDMLAADDVDYVDKIAGKVQDVTDSLIFRAAAAEDPMWNDHNQFMLLDGYSTTNENAYKASTIVDEESQKLFDFYSDKQERGVL